MQDSKNDADSSGKGETNAQEAEMPEIGGLPELVKQAVDTIGQVFTTTFGLVVNSMLIFFVGLLLALSPATYRDGVVKLVPPSKRERATQVMNEIGDTLWRWLLERFGSMLVTGMGAAALLWMIGVPMAGSLGIVTGLLTFIPNIGAAGRDGRNHGFAWVRRIAVDRKLCGDTSDPEATRLNSSSSVDCIPSSHGRAVRNPRRRCCFSVIGGDESRYRKVLH